MKTRSNQPGVSSPVPPIFCHFSDVRYGRPAASTSADAIGAFGVEWPSASTTMAAVVEGIVPEFPADEGREMHGGGVVSH